MILYHGTNADIEPIDLTKGLRYKDFGKGFYLILIGKPRAVWHKREHDSSVELLR